MDIVASKLKPEDFYSPKHEKIYTAALELYVNQDAIDTTTLSDKEPGLATVIRDLGDSVRTIDNVESHVKIVKNLAAKRGILGVATELSRMAYDSDLSEVQAYAKGVITHVLTDDDDRKKLLSPADQVEVLRAMVAKRRRGEAVGLSTGFPNLDRLIGGLRRGNLVVIGARTSIGKSSYAENIGENAAKAGNRVVFVSLEMDPEQIAYRFAKRAGVSDSILDYGADDEASNAALEKFIQTRLQLPLFVHNEPLADTVKIRSMLNQTIAEHGKVDLLIVDYLQLMPDTFGGKLPEHLRLGLITKTLKAMARDYEMPIILITQLNRNSDQRGVLPEPRLSDIRESGRIEEDADVILFLWRTEEDQTGNRTKMKIAKNRQGPTGEVPIRFYEPSFMFSEPK
jgi:replicative DNA helicase